MSSIHADGSVILWSVDDQEALCKLCLPSAVVSEQCLYTSDGKRLLALSGSSLTVTQYLYCLYLCMPMPIGEDIGGLISFDLSSPATSRLLSKHWKEKTKDHPSQDLKEDISTGNIMEVVEGELQKYLKQRYNYTVTTIL